jgi:thymidylate synthase (FAD)
VKAELLGHFGDDLMVVNAARVSYGKSKDSLDEKDARLIRFLVEHGHTSPFRHPQLQFRIQCPIFVERQLFKHQVGLTANSISGRYVDFSDEYWIPENLRLQSKDSKQGSAGDLDPERNSYFLGKISSFIEECRSLYDEMEAAGILRVRPDGLYVLGASHEALRWAITAATATNAQLPEHLLAETGRASLLSILSDLSAPPVIR